ncbi:MAG: hypothetical protein HY359_06350 [Candidatus Rokubacteria bacterium]|nr:hypothetical protein [Candidatus Rokubacteria bacterium]
MRRLTTAILLGITALAPAALAQTAGPSIPAPARDAGIKAKPAAPRPAPRAKKRFARHVVRKAGAARTVTKAKAPVRRMPAKQAVMSGSILV